MKLYVLTIGKDLYYVSRDYEDAEYEKQSAEDDNFAGRKLGIKLTEIEVNENNSSGVEVLLSNGVYYSVDDILSLL